VGLRPAQGRNVGEQGGEIPRAPIQYGGAESLQGRRITAGGAEKSQQCHKYFLQYSKFAFERIPDLTIGAPNFDHGGAGSTRGASNLFFAPGAI